MKPNKLPLYELMIEDEATDEIFAISLVESPAIELDFQYFGKEAIQFAEVSKEKRLIMGPILVPDKRILRIDGEGKNYEVYFKPETVRRLSQMYLERKYNDSATIEHEKKVKGLTLVESWIVDNRFQDKSKAYGFQVPEGSWMGTFLVDKTPEGNKIWDDYVKTGKVKGFSIEGLFSHNLIAAAKIEEQIWSKDVSKLTDEEAVIVLSKIVETLENPSIPSSTYPGEAAGDKKKKKYISPALLEVEDGELNILGYHTKNFKLCPGATALFNHIMEMPMDDDTIGMVRSAAQIADNVFHLEKIAIESGIATQHQYEEAVLLVDDFKDLMREIDEEVGMVHDVSFMDGHIEKIKSFLGE
jgi:hypothetical protein